MNTVCNKETLKRYLEANNLDLILLKSRFLNDLFSEHRFINNGYFCIVFDEASNQLTSCINSYYQGFTKNMSNFRIETDCFGFKVTEIFKWDSLAPNSNPNDIGNENNSAVTIKYNATVTTYFLNRYGKYTKSNIQKFKENSTEALEKRLKTLFPKKNFHSITTKRFSNHKNEFNYFISSLIPKM